MAIPSAEMFAKRLPFMFCLFASALLFLVFVLVFESKSSIRGASPLPLFLISFCLIIYAAEWGEIVRARLGVIGLPRSRWVIGLYVSVVFVSCFLLCYFVSKGRFLFPGLFVILNLPLVFLKEKSSVANASSMT